jgi:FlaA1/EpsC-like NDP-sugar epimerase
MVSPSRRGRGWRWAAARTAILVADLLCLSTGIVLAWVARFDGNLAQIGSAGVLFSAALLLAGFSMAARFLRLHQGRYAVGSVDEMKGLAVAVAIGTAVTSVVDLAAGRFRMVPPSVPPVGGVMAFVVMLALRLAIRSQREGAVRPRTGRPTLVFGAGDAGRQLIASMLATPESPYLPVGMLDDDPTKRHVRIRGVHMLGGRERLALAVRSSAAEVLVIALPSAESTLVRDLLRRTAEAGIEMKVLPHLSDLWSGRVGIRDVRDVDITDLLGRRQVDTNVDTIAGYLRGKRVLVTGAGGSIGSELSRQISRYGPAELMMLDRDESALHAVQLSLRGVAQLDLPEVILADIRDADLMRRMFIQRRPEVLFHAAALKHVNMLEQYPEEGWKTNVLGTRNVLEAASATGVGHFINISTDKAANPVSVLGHSKRLAERLTATYAQMNERRYLSVRFGNVLGSRGSVLDTFAAQIARGGPVTVTHPEATRFFMSIPEAVQLVIQGGAIGAGGEALVLDMGTAVPVAYVAAQLIALDGRPIDIVYTGLRPGEKLHESWFGAGERDRRPVHPLISHVVVPPLDASQLDSLDRGFLASWGFPATGADHRQSTVQL